jgi:gluconolactonase
METMRLVTGLLFFICCTTLPGQKSSIIAKDAKIEKVGGGYAFTEGPAVSAEGHVYFTDQPNDRIYVWEEGKGVSLWVEGTERANGTYFDADGHLLACADLHNRIVRFGSDRKAEVLHEQYEGKRLNGPNDLWITPQGGIYFTDPYYHRNYWEEGYAEEQDVRGVYYLSPEGRLIRVIDDYKQPNGIVGTPDGKTLYVADINDRKIWRYDIQPDGTLANKHLFAPNGSDGMTIDNQGNVYLTMGKIWVYSPQGELIEEIEVPENPSNVCFGGKRRDVLFITARTSVYSLKMRVRGE